MRTKRSFAWAIIAQAIGLSVGAFLGALFGYWFSIQQLAQETQARRNALTELLQNELKQITGSLQRYDAAKAFYRDPFRLNALPRLLDGETLGFRRDARLIELLLNLNVAISRYNDFVQMTNLAQATIVVPDNVHSQWYATVQERLAAVVAVRDEIFKELSRNP